MIPVAPSNKPVTPPPDDGPVGDPVEQADEPGIGDPQETPATSPARPADRPLLHLAPGFVQVRIR